MVTSGTFSGTDLVVRTFEGARPGDEAFAKAYGTLVSDAVRYEYADDLVPHLPPSDVFRGLFSGEGPLRDAMHLNKGLAYASVGQLKYIARDGSISSDSALLQAQRLFHLATAIATQKFKEIADDHGIDCGTGVMTTICPTGVCS
jgi:hypothetical protein